MEEGFKNVIPQFDRFTTTLGLHDGGHITWGSPGSELAPGTRSTTDGHWVCHPSRVITHKDGHQIRPISHQIKRP